MGDRGQSLDVRSEYPREGTGLGLAQLRELDGDVGHRAVVLAHLHADTRRSSRGSVALGGQRTREALGALGDRAPGHLRRDYLCQAVCAVRGERRDGVGSPGLVQIAQRRGREVVVGVRECGAPLVGQGVRTCRTATPPVRDRAGFALDEDTLGDQRVEMASDRGGRDAERLGERGRRLRAAAQHLTRDRVAGAALAVEFHNTSMTYFGGLASTGAAAHISPSGREILTVCCTGRWS